MQHCSSTSFFRAFDATQVSLDEGRSFWWGGVRIYEAMSNLLHWSPSIRKLNNKWSRFSLHLKFLMQCINCGLQSFFGYKFQKDTSFVTPISIPDDVYFTYFAKRGRQFPDRIFFRISCCHAYKKFIFLLGVVNMYVRDGLASIGKHKLMVEFFLNFNAAVKNQNVTNAHPKCWPVYLPRITSNSLIGPYTDKVENKASSLIDFGTCPTNTFTGPRSASSVVTGISS